MVLYMMISASFVVLVSIFYFPHSVSYLVDPMTLGLWSYFKGHWWSPSWRLCQLVSLHFLFISHPVGCRRSSCSLLLEGPYCIMLSLYNPSHLSWCLWPMKPCLTPQHNHFIPAAHDSRCTTPSVLMLQVIIDISPSLCTWAPRRPRLHFIWLSSMLNRVSFSEFAISYPAMKMHNLAVREESLDFWLPRRAYCHGWARDSPSSLLHKHVKQSLY